MIEPFRRVRTTDDDLRQVQDAAATTFRAITNREILDGQLVNGVKLLSTGPNSIEHKLGREPSGWIIVGKSANATVWDSQATNKTPGRTLVLNTSASVTINLWVF